MPKLPPGPGFEGEAEYLRQVEVWNKWVEWEKDDPLVLKGEDFSAFTARVVYVYKQAVMALRFWPETWYNAAEFCFQNGLESEGDEFLSQAVIANPESCLLAFRQADHAERTSTSDETAENLQRRGGAVRAPFDRVLTALYDLLEQNKNRELRQIADLELSMQQSRLSPANSIDEAGDEERADENVNDRAGGAIKGKETALRSQMEEIQTGNAAQTKVISKTISFAWVALMRAMRRVQGKGKVGDVVGGSRQIFADARKRGRITSDVYIASALIEYHCYKDPAATKIFERGMKIFEDDENFALEYLKHLIAINDITST